MLARFSPRAVCKLPLLAYTSVCCRRAISSSQLPRVMQPSIWQSMIPKPLRNTPSSSSAPKAPRVRLAKTRAFFSHPTTPIFLLALLIGSQAIQLLGVKNEMRAYSRQADAKIALLREVIQRVQNGEDVDVEKILGTGDPQMEQEWWDVIKELESEEEYQKKVKAQVERRRLMRRGIRPETVGEGGPGIEQPVNNLEERPVDESEPSVEIERQKKDGKPVFL